LIVIQDILVRQYGLSGDFPVVVVEVAGCAVDVAGPTCVACREQLAVDDLFHDHFFDFAHC
jgi:hypothetical protein